MNRKAVTAKLALAAVLAINAWAQAQSSTNTHAGLTNPGFEEPRVKVAGFALVETLPGWTTTDTHFEIWGTGHLGVTAHEGTQFAELNAYNDGTLYQDSKGIQQDSVLEFTFAHRGRSGKDTMKLTITDLGADNALDGGDDTVLFSKEYTTDNVQWVTYNSKTEKPIKALGNQVRFAYGAVSTATGELKEGNLLDAANFGIGVIAMQEAAKLTFEWSGRVGNDSSAALVDGLVVGDSGWQLNGTPLAADTMIKFRYTIPDTARDTDESPSAGRYTEGTLNVSIPSMGLDSAPNKDYHLLFGTDGKSDYVVAQPFDNTGFGLVGNWPAKADPWPNPNALSTIANPKASEIFGTSPDRIFTLTLKSGDVLTTAFTELLANPVFSSSSSARPTPPPADAMKLDIDSGPFTFGYSTSNEPGFHQFTATDYPFPKDPNIKRLNRNKGDWFSFVQNTGDTASDPRNTSTVHYPAKNEGSGVLHPGPNQGDVAMARFTAERDGEYHFNITATVIAEKPTGVGVTIYVGDEVVDKKHMTEHQVPWIKRFSRTLSKGQTVDIAVDNGEGKNWTLDHVLVTPLWWTTP